MRFVMKRLILATLVSTASWLAMASSPAQSPEAIVVKAQVEGLDPVLAREVFHRVDAALDRVCRDNPGTTPSCTVLLTGVALRDGMEILELSGGRLQIYLPDAAEGWITDRARLGSLLGALLLQRLGRPVMPGHKRLPEWLKAGLVRLLETRLDRGRLPGVPRYPGLRGMLEAGVEYPLDRLLQEPLAPSGNPTYVLQMEAGEVLLLGILRLPEGRKLLAELVVAMVEDKRLPEQAFGEVLGETVLRVVTSRGELAADFPGEQVRQRWFGEVVRQAVINPFYPATAKLAERWFREVETVSYQPLVVVGAPAAAAQACPLEELADRWPEMDQPAKVLAKQLQTTSELHFMASEILRPPLEEMLAACRALERGSRRGFAGRMAAARRDFYERLARLAAIEQRLRELESAMLPPGQRYDQELKAVVQARGRQRQLWPELEALLDREEALLEGTPPGADRGK